MTSPPIANTLFEGDCLEVMRGWPDACVDHCIADPPFGIASGRGRRSKRGLGWAFSSHVTMQEAWDQFTEDEYFRFSVDWLREVCRVVKPNGNMLVFGTYHSIYLLGQGLSVILDSPSFFETIPAKGAAIAETRCVPYYFIECICADRDELARRLRERPRLRSNPGDEALADGRGTIAPPGAYLRIDTTQPLERCLALALDYAGVPSR